MAEVKADEKEFSSHDMRDDSSFHGSSNKNSIESLRAALKQEAFPRLARRHSRASQLSHTSHDTDPLEPLELAISGAYNTMGDEDNFDREAVSRVHTAASVRSMASRPPDFEVYFEDDDPANPRYWPLWYRAWCLVCISFTTWVVVFYSTSYTASIPGLQAEFGVTNTAVTTLGVTAYLLGLASGSLCAAPSSELFGRRPVYIASMVVFTLLVIPACVATSLEEIIAVRFFGALFGAVMITNSAGSVVDISTEETRALVMSLWSIAPMNGPTTGPVIGGFVYQYLGWRWDNWLVLIMAGVGTLLMVTVRETYAPIILKKKAAQLRKETDDDRWWCRYDVKKSSAELLKINLIRPFTLAFTEPILWFFNLWISLIYGVLYMCFAAYPIVFSQYRGWGPGISGLSFVGIGTGTMMTICAEPWLRKIINSHPKNPETGKVPPEATARVMILGAVLTPIGQLVFSWTCLPVTIHWAVPIAFGIPFGAGNTISFIYGSNYLAGAYGVYAASALAGNAVTRSLFGGTLPLAAPSMYKALTPQWAGTLMGLLEVAMIPIPIIFYKYGARIRAKSKVIKRMREDQERNERRATTRARRQEERREEAQSSEENPSGGGAVFEKETGVPPRDRDMEKEAGKLS
ncbi:Major facilitator superfamily transporter [Apiospora rasikravindrae]|uniref:Major facilitator superfamily transporter n=1 Tax=Apiospora rasikravindrae TaxID=990691 RepID=A0ABR1U8I2_9PEZI